ncbi:hypothetical protein [Natronorubrum thiooxidans]|uniref:Uncharacterized protein n=1 Tax=Natronorubrum thiooxidans TaxID=308853 RepID=A0A1N7C2J7_9EURY|nr:hypothetical protein [Natronorubrum thiooxidans]SIR57800.1 hypothetical protein SAMN05421752_10178 [Natronorubrum thiooxidans]
MESSETTSTLGIALGAVLIGVGIAAYVLSDFASITALIPAVFGVIIAILGVVGRQTERRRVAVIGIGVLALLGVVGSARGISDVIALLTGGTVDSTIAAVAQGSMILVGLILLFTVGRELGRN